MKTSKSRFMVSEDKRKIAMTWSSVKRKEEEKGSLKVNGSYREIDELLDGNGKYMHK